MIALTERAAELPDVPALTDDRIVLTWHEVADRVARAVNALRELNLGVERRVAVYAENSAETVIAHVAGIFSGCSVVPVNFHLTADEVAYILRDSQAALLFVGPETLVRGREAAEIAGIRSVIAWRSDSPTDPVTDWDSWLASSSNEVPPTDIRPLPNLMYTSGTTGFPKGVELPPTMFAGGDNMVEHTEGLRQNRFVKYGTHMVVGPMYHTGPLNGVRILAAGTSVVVLGRYDPERVLALVERHRIETTVMVPTHFKRLLDLPADVKARYDLSSLQLVVHTGAACPIDIKHQMITWLQADFLDAYGATEVGTICSINASDWLAHPGSVGRCINPPFVRAIVVDDDGNELPAGQEGRLFFEDSSGRGIVYPNDPDKTAKAHLRPGVFTIGEIGYVDHDGFVYITDRFSDMIVSGGVNIYPAEAENVIIEHPDVADVAVIGVPDADMGEAVKALVVLADSSDADAPTAEELIGLCRSQLSGYKCPRTVEFVSTVGRNAMGKVNKRALRAPYWEGHRTIG